MCYNVVSTERKECTMVITVEKLTHTYGERVLFKDISFSVDTGDKIGVIGDY